MGAVKVGGELAPFMQEAMAAGAWPNDRDPISLNFIVRRLQMRACFGNLCRRFTFDVPPRF